MKFRDSKTNGIPGIAQLTAVAVCALALLAQLPSGIAHIYLGKWVYLRDAILGVFFLIGVVLFDETRRLRPVHWLIVYISLLLTLLVINFRFNEIISILLIGKWILLWSVSLYVGHEMHEKLGRNSVRLFFLAFVVYALGEAVVGYFEFRTNTYFLDTGASETTGAGVLLAVSQQIEGNVRVRGLQRDVFLYANIMGAAAVTAVGLSFQYKRHRYLLILNCVIAISLFLSLLYSGGRSALYGVLFAAPAFGLALFNQRRIRALVTLYCALCWIAVCSITIIGVGKVTAYIVDILGINAFYANADSSFMRDVVWAEKWNALQESFMSVFIGAPTATHVPEKFLITDNWFVWNAYHGGIVLVASMIAGTISLQRFAGQSRQFGVLSTALFGFLIGESLARESYMYYSAILYFVAAGAAISDLFREMSSIRR